MAKIRYIKTRGGLRILKIKSDKKIEELLKIGCSEVDEDGTAVKAKPKTKEPGKEQ